MPRRLPRPIRRAVLLCAALAVLVPSCSKPYDGVSDYDREQQAKQAAAEAAKGSGLKMTEKTYPLGKAWVVDMQGMTVSDDHFKRLKEAGNVAELDLSKSTITDDQLGRMRELGACTTLYKLNLSNTAVTDAGLQKMEGLPFLINVNARGTKVTQAGVDRYKGSRANNPQIGPNFRTATVTR
jgi:hypothetical protein